MKKPHAGSTPSKLRNLNSGVFILLLISSLMFSALSSTTFPGVSAQTDNRSLQSSTDDRANQTMDNAKKLRQVPGEKVPNQYIVVLKDTNAPSASVRASADEARNRGALVRHVYEYVLRGFAISIPGKGLSSSTQSHSKDGKSSSNTAVRSSPADQSPSLNKPPVARDDRIQTESNIPVEIGILANDNDPDGDKLKIMSVTSPSQNVGVVTINENDTITFFPGIDYAGTVRFSYTISDGEGNSDKAKVSVTIKASTERTSDQSEQGQTQDQDVQENQHELVKTHHEIQEDSKASSELSPQEFHRGGGTNDTDNGIP